MIRPTTVPQAIHNSHGRRGKSIDGFITLSQTK